MPATSYVRVHRKSPPYYARPERTLFNSTEDTGNVWDGSLEGEDSREKDSTEDELLSRALVECPETGSEQQWKLLEALDALSTWGVRSRRSTSVLEVASLVDALIEHMVARRADHFRKGNTCTTDGLCCPICEGVLRYPVTATCGHTFCRQCCFGHSSCTVCGQRFPSFSDALASPASSSTAFTSTPSSSSASSSSSSSTVTSAAYRALPAPVSAEGVEVTSSIVGFELDILIRRLVERWWGPELKAADLHEEAQRHLEDNSLDEALRCCNQSLEHEETNRRTVSD
uniref:RING-type domain-containing protein n=1 Tax=Anopheles epiroticus TaxID=199890 RepID=A0A182PIM6_9DIPT